MTPETGLLIVATGFIIVLFLGYPLAFTLGGLSVIFGYTLWDNPAVLNMFIRTVFNVGSNISYVSCLLFIFMGCVLERSGAADDMFESMYIIFGRIRGGLAIGTVVICTLLAAATGIIGASISMMTMLALPSMMHYKYDRKLAFGTIMGAGCLGTIIPPSIILVIYGAQAQISIGKLFAGGIGAGLLLSTLYLIYIIVRTIINPNLGPAISKEEADKYSFKDKVYLIIKSIVPTLGLILTVLGSILGGIATPTEAAALGCVGAMLIALAYKRFTWEMIKDSCYSAMKTNAMIMWIILAASMFTSVFLGLGGSKVISSFVTNLGVGKWAIFGVISILLIIMGMFIDSYGVLLIGIPIFTPIVYALGFDPVWFAIMFAVFIQLSYLSPPFSYAAFYLKGVSKEQINISEVYNATFPFLALQIIAVIILCIFPEIITYLPSKMM